MRRTGSLELSAVLGAVVLLGSACGDDDAVGPGPTGEPTPAVTDTAAPTATASPTEPPVTTAPPTATASPTPTGTGAPDAATDGTAQTFLVAPQEPREVSVGAQAEFSVGGTYSERDVPDRLWLGVVPCEDYDLDARAFTISDGTAEGFDEAFGPRIYDVNGERYENVDDIWPTEVHVEEGLLTFTVLSEQEACAIPTVFEDTNDNGELDVDDQGTPVEPYGIGMATWS